MSDRVIIKRQDRVDYILDGICSYYKVSRGDMNKRIRNPQRFAKKRIAMQLLHEVADCSLKEVCYLLGYSGNSMPDIYRHINDIKEDVLYDKNLGREYKEILKQLGI